MVASVFIDMVDDGKRKISTLDPGALVGVGGGAVAVGTGVDVGTIESRGEQYWLSRAQALSVSSLESSNSCSWAWARLRRL